MDKPGPLQSLSRFPILPPAWRIFIIALGNYGFRSALSKISLTLPGLSICWRAFFYVIRFVIQSSHKEKQEPGIYAKFLF